MKRKLLIPFMGGVVPIWVSSPEDESAVKLQAKLRTRAVGCSGGMLPFCYETWILGDRSVRPCPVFFKIQFSAQPCGRAILNMLCLFMLNTDQLEQINMLLLEHSISNAQ
jgi:hypothetical protein